MNKHLLKRINRMSNEEVYNLIYTDHLTGAMNRRAFDDNHEPGQLLAIVDVDSLKYMNDHHGHNCGNKLIQELADFLILYYGQENVYRLGGDEFAVIGDCFKALAYESCGLPIFSYGVGKTLTSADRELILSKTDRIVTGKRVKRGEKPQWEQLYI